MEPRSNKIWLAEEYSWLQYSRGPAQRFYTAQTARSRQSPHLQCSSNGISAGPNHTWLTEITGTNLYSPNSCFRAISRHWHCQSSIKRSMSLSISIFRQPYFLPSPSFYELDPFAAEFSIANRTLSIVLSPTWSRSRLWPYLEHGSLPQELPRSTFQGKSK